MTGMLNTTQCGTAAVAVFRPIAPAAVFPVRRNYEVRLSLAMMNIELMSAKSNARLQDFVSVANRRRA